MAKFYEAVLHTITNDNLMKITKGSSVEERLGTPKGKCPECGNDEWWLLPVQSASVKEGGKPYCECMKCGYLTHL